MRIGSRHYEVEWGHIVFLLVIAGIVAGYLADAMSVSMSLHNLLFIAPVGVFALILCIAILPQCFRQKGKTVSAPRSLKPAIGVMSIPDGGKDLLLIAGVAVALGFLVFMINIIGFDMAILIFCVVAMALCGERRPLPLIIYPLAVTLVVVLGFRAILPYPMYTLIL